MKKEEKQLLLKDLYWRIPYGVKIATSQYQYGNISTPTGIVGDKCYFGDNPRYDGDCPVEDVKPYLRSMTSITVKEVFEYLSVCAKDNKDTLTAPRYFGLDYLLSRHLDFRGLIPMGLALEAPEDMYIRK